MANPWFRLWTDMVNDPKWRTIARKSGQKIGDVIAVYVHMMTCASNASERGRTEGWNDEDVATALDIDTEQVTAIREAMQGRVLDGDYLTGWEKRQPLREDGSAERAKAWRDAKKQGANAGERKQTPEEIREEEIRRKEEEAARKAATPPALPAEEVAFEFPLNDGAKYPLLKTQVEEFSTLYPAVNIDAELRACLGWNIANPERRKTRRGILSHINTWLADKQNKPGQANAGAAGGTQGNNKFRGAK